MRRPPAAWRLAAAAVVLVPAAACDLPGFGAPEPKAEEGESIFSLWQGFFVVAIFVALLVWGLLVFVMLRFRRRDETIPRQNPYNIPVEVLYTVAPVLVVAVLFGFSVAAEGEATDLEPDPVAHIDVVGFQWSWQFAYTDENVVVTGEPGEPPELVLPVGEPVQLRLLSADVNHSFWVPDFLSKRDLIPGVDNDISITPTEIGEYDGRCAEFCGLDHWRMNYTVRVVEPEEYEDWLADQPRGTEGVEVDEEEDTAGSGGRGDGDSSGDSQEGPTGEGGP
ncbi:MAG TPA: cytochrome c oxidase subunit II [Acidimicrobiales bacterium]|nr:cytochrome c oxidase subunit II [Acidimicrobiales bacterium]